jgi:hypothetical protein
VRKQTQEGNTDDVVEETDVGNLQDGEAFWFAGNIIIPYK